jgi:NTP pyrophosphatase (non-canonical NTP hydrolase)
MTPEEQLVLDSLLIFAIKELGEIADCIVKGEDDRPGHWKNELGDLCGLAIQPMLALAEIEYEDACAIGVQRMRSKTAASE